MTRMARMLHIFPLACACLLLGPVGCQTGTGIMTYKQGTPPIVVKAPSDGEYALFNSTATDPEVTFYLHKGDPLGFKTGKTGEIIAVAGTTDVTEPDGNYVWRRRDPQAAKPATATGTSTGVTSTGQ